MFENETIDHCLTAYQHHVDLRYRNCLAFSVRRSCFSGGEERPPHSPPAPVGAHSDGHQHGAFTESALLFWVNNFLKCFACEKSYWPESWRGSFYINLISFLRFWNLSFYFIFASVRVKTNNKTKRVSSGVKLVWNHTRDFKTRWVRRESSIWYHKHDFRPQLHDTKLTYLFNLLQPFWNFKTQWVPKFNWSSWWLVESKIVTP